MLALLPAAPISLAGRPGGPQLRLGCTCPVRSNGSLAFCSVPGFLAVVLVVGQ